MIEYLNEKDKRAYALIRNRLIHDQEQPTLREINEVTGNKSPRSAVLTLKRLEEAGLIKKRGSKIRLVSDAASSNSSISTVEVPLVGAVAAGAPILAEQNVEAEIAVSTELAKPKNDYFLLRVSGDSMNQAKIRGNKLVNGSIVLVRQQNTADDKEIVVALINDEATVKIFERKNNVVVLKPKSSKSYEPIVLTEDCMIQGVVVAVLPSDLIN